MTLAAVFNLQIWTMHYIKIGESAQEQYPMIKLRSCSKTLIYIFTTAYVTSVVMIVILYFLLATPELKQKEIDK